MTRRLREHVSKTATIFKAAQNSRLTKDIDKCQDPLDNGRFVVVAFVFCNAEGNGERQLDYDEDQFDAE